MFLPAEIIPDEIMSACKLHDKAHNNKIHISINKRTDMLKESGALANKELQEHLQPHGYSPARNTPGLWKHKTNDLVFVLVVDDFGMKHANESDAQHLTQALEDKHEDVEASWKGVESCEITLNWDHTK